MANQVTVIDYGVGNLRSVVKAFEKLGFAVRLVSEPGEIEGAQKLVLPGVGAFGAGMENLRRLKLIEPIKAHIASGKPFLGICLGMQLLFRESLEMGHHEGLGVIAGKVVRFPDADSLKVPHMGWNGLKVHKPNPLFDGVSEGAMVYFVHSYFCVPDSNEVIAATTEHGVEFCSAVAFENVFGTQFHPEKSSRVGLTMLQNFAQM